MKEGEKQKTSLQLFHTRSLATASGAHTKLPLIDPLETRCGTGGHCDGMLHTVTKRLFIVRATSTLVTTHVVPLSAGTEAKNTELRSLPPIAGCEQGVVLVQAVTVAMQ